MPVLSSRRLTGFAIFLVDIFVAIFTRTGNCPQRFAGRKLFQLAITNVPPLPPWMRRLGIGMLRDEHEPADLA
jgi:hypothetical protein